MADVDQNAVRSLVDRIAASDGFVNSERLCRFLRFTVDAWLKGEGDQIKEYVIGREVFDRDDRYDPRTDPIVRVEARRLRKKLEEFYAGPGHEEPLKIWYQKGTYSPSILEPTIAVPKADEEPLPNNRRKWLLVAAPVLAIAGLGAWAVRRPNQQKPKVVVLPARWVWKSEDFTQTHLDVDLAERLAAELANRHGIRVASWPLVQNYAKRQSKVTEISKELGVSKALLIAVRVEAEGPRVTAYLVDTVVDRKIRVTDKEGRPVGTPQQRQQMAVAIAAEMAAVLN